MSNFNLKNGKSINTDELKKAVESGKTQDFIDKNLSAEASEKMKAILKDKDAMSKMLSTPQAKELFNKLMNKE